MSIISFNGIDYGCSGSPKIEQITEANYQALVQAGEVDPSIAYFRIDAPSLYPLIQDDATATDLENGKLATGQTIESYVSKLLNPTVYSPGTGCTLVKVGKIVICDFSGLGGMNNFSTGSGAELINNVHSEYRPRVNATGIGQIYNSDSANYVATIDILTTGYMIIRYKNAVNTRTGGVSSSYVLFGTMCWITD